MTQRCTGAPFPFTVLSWSLLLVLCTLKVSGVEVSDAPTSEGAVVELTAETFDSFRKEYSATVIIFYTPCITSHPSHLTLTSRVQTFTSDAPGIPVGCTGGASYMGC